MKNICSIYIIKNTINDKVYIGQTWKDICTRFDEHRRANYKNCPKLYYALNKYGRNNFFVELIDTCNTQYDADELECYWIKFYDSIKNGYNLRDGGDTGKHSIESLEKMSKCHEGQIPWNKGKTGIYSDASLKKMSEAKIGTKLSDEAKVKVSDANTGRIHSEEARKKMSDANKGKPKSDEHKKKISKAKAGKKLPEEIKKKISNTLSSISEDTIKEIKYLFYVKNYKQKQIAALFNINNGTVSRILSGKRRRFS